MLSLFRVAKINLKKFGIQLLILASSCRNFGIKLQSLFGNPGFLVLDLIRFVSDFAVVLKMVNP